MLVVGRAGLLELQDHFVTSPEIQSLMKRVVIEPDDREDPATPGKLPFDCLTVEMNDGRVIESRQVKHIRGGAELPLSRDALWGKFEDCVKSALVNIPALEVFNALMSLETVANVNQMQYAS
jgi:2-methylcitrate dehydratase PrpD